MSPIQLREDLMREPAPPLLRSDEGPPFRDLWEAEAFAIGNLLIRQGVISCKEWETAISHAILRAQASGDPDRGDTYFNHWADALETLLISHGFTDREVLSEQQALWDRAIRKTPHGVALSLENAFLPDDHAHHHDHDHDHDHGHDHHHHAHGPARGAGGDISGLITPVAVSRQDEAVEDD